jgi:hypothetical protein
MGLTYLNATMIEQPASIQQLSATNLQAFNLQTSNLTADNFRIANITSSPTITGNTIVGGSLTAVQGLFDGVGSSQQWNNAYATLYALSGSWEESDHIVPTITNYLSTNNVLISSIRVSTNNTSDQWNSTYNTVLTLSGTWQQIYTSLLNYLSTTPNVQISSIAVSTGNTSDQWNNTYTTVVTNSASWEESADIIPTTTNYLSTNHVQISSITVNTGNTSDQWNSAYTTVITNSASWEESATIIPTVTNYLSTNNIAISALQVAGSTLSGNKDLLDIFLLASIYPNITAKQTQTDTNISNLSSYYEAPVSVVTTNSADWIGTRMTVATGSINWNNTYNTFRENSATWLDNVTVIPAIANYLPSSRYELPITLVTNQSSEWINSTILVNANNRFWDSVYTTVLQSSANWVLLPNWPQLFLSSLLSYFSSSNVPLSVALFNEMSGDYLEVNNLHTLGLISHYASVEDLNVNNLTFTGITALSTINKLSINDLVVNSLTALSATYTTYQIATVLTSANLLTATNIETNSIVVNSVQANIITTPTSDSNAWATAYNQSSQMSLSTNLWNQAYNNTQGVSLSGNFWNSTYKLVSANSANWDTAYVQVSTGDIIKQGLSATLEYITNNLFNTSNLNVSADNALPGLFVTQIGSGKALVVADDTDPDATPFVIDSQGGVSIGYTETLLTENYIGDTVLPKLQVIGTTTSNSSFGLYSFSNTPDRSPTIIFTRSGASGIGNIGLVTENMSLGGISWAGDDGSNKIAAASIMAAVDGAPSSSNMPTRITLSTTPSGGNTPVEHVRVTSSGMIGVGTVIPNHKLTVVGNISATGILATTSGTSLNWNDTYTTVVNNSASWEETTSIVPTITNYLSTSNILVSGLNSTNNLTVVGNISASGTIYTANTLTTSVCAISGNGGTPFVMQFTNGLLTGITF